MVVVENEVEKTPVEELYPRGNTALNDDDEILLLKLFQSVEERKPLAVLLDCASVRRDPERDSGPENESELMAPTPLPTKIPLRVVLPVPPFPIPSVPKMLFAEKVEVAETMPALFA